MISHLKGMFQRRINVQYGSAVKRKSPFYHLHTRNSNLGLLKSVDNTTQGTLNKNRKKGF